MSDDGEQATHSGFSTPVPELDDHRHRLPTLPRSERPRRGTFDSLYGSQPRESTARNDFAPHVRDFEEAILDDEAGDTVATPAAVTSRSRRPTVDSNHQPRSVSPPNSVKAFAEARRQRDLSFDDIKGDKRPDEQDICRTASVISRMSHHSRPQTVHADDAASLATNKSAEEDVCFPVQVDHAKDSIYIDFDYLENFIKEEAETRANQNRQSDTHVFPDLRSESHASGGPVTRMTTVDGDFIDVPSENAVEKEKAAAQGNGQDAAPSESARIVQTDPNRVSFFSSAWESTIHAAELGDLVLPGEDIRGLFEFPKDETDGVWWLNINNPSEEEARAVCRSFGVHPLTVEDITTQESREKIELFSRYYFACFRSFRIVRDEFEQEEFEPLYIYVIVFREGTLSFSYQSNAHASHVRRRISMLKDYVSLSSDWICYALIDDIVDSFAPVISRIERDTDQIEDDVFIAREDDTNAFLRKIGTVRRNVMALMRLLGGKADVLRGFTKRCNENYKVTPRMDIGLYLGDIQDHVVTMMNNLGHFEKMLSRSHSNYLAQLSIDGILQGTSTNKRLNKITLLASIIVPLNVITGLFGMNVRIPFYLEDNLNAFFGIVAIMLGFCIFMVLMARRFHYI